MSIQWLLTLFLLPSFARATMIPLSPGPGDVFRSGSPCPISWDTDRSGSTQPWRNATICMQSQHHPIFILKFGYHTVLMSGSNLNMSRVTVVVERLDGTNISSYNWLCPNVTPNADIYFYQFSNNGNSIGSAWTTRFTIASYSGNTTPPEKSKQPGGAPIPWGVGHLVPSNRTIPSSPIVSPRSRSLPIHPCETLKQKCMTSLEDDSPSAPLLLQQRTVPHPAIIDQLKLTRERRPSSRGNRGGPNLSVHLLCALATLWLVVL
ncbi:hypothetical protein CY34DRAFT_797727 [Suillus luteus UH-Slu-Lm8-n1]|uniref:Yeast cell wall synthesis Kre9/Knh1-like N-terminal domain-containing protein n=1 Tax=Suillus luteus UH-Slu-Lm8-n1 TaxID=930992 RepID=A0A0D0AFF8_9AGAM|nr:hypothetical protein CY34DRAFT_797727 [Suillus luteus UH-Slu-Lm8-n1]